ncbi:sodium/proline symporter [Virgibacillus salexigens]|uniref:sodium/proline symporter n=1 Tax=Virgibacillus TaxID=84406 RepID=UPI00136F2AB0|nr:MULTISPECIES: sodium/proline symporter [Virgibacillus]MYL42014.1 sodium/solute symporter [Virgibacillus massiliensis]
MNIIAVEFFIYCLVLLTIGYAFSKRSKTHSEFLLGGKKLPGWALAFSERATGESAWLLLGYTGFVFMTGLSGIWVAVGIAIGIIFAWLFLAKKFMQETDKYHVLTLPDYLAVRFGQKAKVIRWLTSILIASFLMFYVGAQMAGAGKMLFTTFGIPHAAGIILATIVIIIIAFAGGFISVVWTDMIQSVMMVITLVALPIMAFFYIQSHGLSITESLYQAGPTFNSWFGGLTGFSIGVLFFNNFSWFFGFLGGQPQLSARFMALKNNKQAKQGSIVAITWTILAYGGAFMIGLAAITMYDQGSFKDVEIILPTMILDLFSPWIAGLLLAGVLAAIITTADSQLMVITSSISEDIIHKTFKMEFSEKQFVWISRLTIVVFGVIGMIIALVSESLLYLVVSWAWAGVGCTLSPAILLTFFWKKYSSAGVVATVVSGLISTIIWISTPLEGMITSKFTTFLIAGCLGVIFSLVLPDQNEANVPKEETI